MVGEPTIDCLAATQDIYAAMICLVAGDKASALATAQTFSAGITATVEENYDWYVPTARSTGPVGR